MAALDFPANPTVGQQYAAPNGVTYQWDGAVWVVTGGPPGQLWTGGTGTLTPTDTTKTVAVPAHEAVRAGSRTVKTRLVGASTLDYAVLSLNAMLNAAEAVWIQDDATKASWLISTETAGDSFHVARIPAGGAWTSLLALDNAGNLVINGPTGQKSTGTTWANPSDRRLKKNVEPYAQGLAAILALEPKTFEFNGLAGSQDGLPGIGLIADEVQPVMPEMVSTQSTKLHTDDATPVDLLMLDTTALAMALINAVKEVATRVTTLETAIAAATHA